MRFICKNTHAKNLKSWFFLRRKTVFFIQIINEKVLDKTDCLQKNLHVNFKFDISQNGCMRTVPWGNRFDIGNLDVY